MIAGASIWDPLPQRVAIFRALNLGDLLCSIPAVRALRRALPDASITLIGLESARSVVERFPHYFDELLLFPGDPAFPEQSARLDEVPDFYRQLQAREFDLILQMHGSGKRSNDIVQAMGGRRWAGFVPDPANEEPGRLFAWPDKAPEIRRYLLLMEHLGLAPESAALEFPLSESDDEEAERLAGTLGLDLDRTVFVHPGARLESRRWPVERFAAVSAALAEQGWQIAVTGSPAEASLVKALTSQLAQPVVDLCGATSMGGLASLLQRGRLLVCNDTGISHIAAAVKLPSVVIASGSDVARWAPLDTSRHRVLYHATVCRPCSYHQCPIGHPCAEGVSVEQVLEAANAQLEETATPAGVGMVEGCDIFDGSIL